MPMVCQEGGGGGGGGDVEASIRLVHYLTWLSTLIEKLIKPYRITVLPNTGKSAIRERGMNYYRLK